MWAHGWEISYCFVHICELKKTICEYHFSFTTWVKKNQVYNINYFSSPMWIKKTSCESTSVKHSFLSSFTWVKKSLASSQGSNILSCLFILLFWLWPFCCSQCNFWHWSSSWCFLKVYVQSFVIIFSSNRKVDIFKFLGSFAYWN